MIRRVLARLDPMVELFRAPSPVPIDDHLVDAVEIMGQARAALARSEMILAMSRRPLPEVAWFSLKPGALAGDPGGRGATSAASLPPASLSSASWLNADQKMPCTNHARFPVSGSTPSPLR